MSITTLRLSDKRELLAHYRGLSVKHLRNVRAISGDRKTMSARLNKFIVKDRKDLISHIEETSKNEGWPKEDILSCVLLATYTSYVVMLESRNTVWPYDYMAFSRRIGELWEPFCLLCWDYPVNDKIQYTEPPTFAEVRKNLKNTIQSAVDELNTSQEKRDALIGMYEAVWGLVSSGEIKLKSDLHFKDESRDYVVDFKSGFSSNEKGNTNRLLMVASIYKALKGYDCLLFVRSEEETNNHYLKTLKKSGLWRVYCGAETYEQIKKFSQFDLMSWMRQNIDWEHDFDREMYEYVKTNRLVQYLEW